ncbi:SurA N-terminal domain-containing protein [Cohnella sp. JJ-181]|uniref:SurA N-terminal domain-containing protein n=1 Tax=Cohnella rhizoplanae TaxID=2974897 RepID=UPI0022FFABAC|nr:SurA N-terminal domain-containing protein [Cohnella sp. JJ-181]CAI6086213.1 Chaperone SurA [Cohnella sp. JJ-181]
MKNKIRFLSIFALITAVTAALAATVFASTPIGSLFTDMKAERSKPGNMPATNVIATVNSKEITYLEFREYKENLKMMAKKEGMPFKRSNTDILNDMIKTQLTVQYAMKKGIAVSDEEVQSYANEQREALQASIEGKALIKNLVEKSGLPENEYWKSNKLLAAYRDWMISLKLMESDPSLATSESLESFQEFLLKNAGQGVNIDQQNFSRL